MEVVVSQSPVEASCAAARFVKNRLLDKPDLVLGLATGGSPLELYRELIRMHAEDGLDFGRVATFNLDEYVGLDKNHPHSYARYTRENFLDHINVETANIHGLDGAGADIPTTCDNYERAIAGLGGVDVQLLGIGVDGHIGFNEPTSSFSARTRIKTLAPQTISDNARFFDEDPDRVPRHCITMGIGTIMEAKCQIMLAFGDEKADAVAAMVEGPVRAMVPASILQHHPNVKLFIDEAAASKLTLLEYYRWVNDNKPDWQIDK